MAPFQQDSSARVAYDLIPPERSLLRTGQKAAVPCDVEDAEFEVVSTIPKARAHASFNDNSRNTYMRRPQTSARENFGLGVASAKTEPAAKLSRLPHYGLAALGAVFLLTLGIAAFFNLGAFAAADGGLVITDIQQSPVDSNGLRVIELSGSVVNRSRDAQALPALIARMTSDSGAINQSAISLGDGLLASGGTARFTLRIPSPGGKRQEVSISFAPKGV